MSKHDVQVIKPPSTLAAKAKKDAGGSIAERLDRAEATIAEFGKDFPKWGLEEIEKIESALATGRQDPKDFTESRQDANARDIDIIAAHVDGLRVVLVQKIRGDGGKVGRQIVAGLLQLTQK
jgi:hypothetical protein